MRTDEEINEVLNKIDDIDPDRDDRELQHLRYALEFALGYTAGTVQQFIANYIDG